jgi:hypothetical protein
MSYKVLYCKYPIIKYYIYPTTLKHHVSKCASKSIYKRANNKPNLLPFDFVLIQNGKQIDRIPGIAQVGMNVPHYVFPNSGPTTIRVENIGGTKICFCAVWYYCI